MLPLYLVWAMLYVETVVKSCLTTVIGKIILRDSYIIGNELWNQGVYSWWNELILQTHLCSYLIDHRLWQPQIHHVYGTIPHPLAKWARIRSTVFRNSTHKVALTVQFAKLETIRILNCQNFISLRYQFYWSLAAIISEMFHVHLWNLSSNIYWLLSYWPTIFSLR